VWPGFTALLVAALALFAVNPAGAVGLQVLSAPFSHTHAVFTPSTLSAGPCAATDRISGMSWNATSGTFDGAVVVGVRSCSAPLTGPAQAYASAAVLIMVAIPVHVHTGPHNFSLATSYDLTVVTATTGPLLCPKPSQSPGQSSSRTCFLETAATARWNFQLFDATNQTRLGGSMTAVQGPTTDLDQKNTTACNGSGSCTTTGSSSNCTVFSWAYSHCVPSGTPVTGANSTWLNTGRNCVNLYGGRCFGWENWTLNSTHQYWVLVFFQSYSWVNDYHYAPGSGLLARVTPGIPGGAMLQLNSLNIR
jgi:hypothetical protein